jgi:hypothetical protein
MRLSKDDRHHGFVTMNRFASLLARRPDRCLSLFTVMTPEQAMSNLFVAISNAPMTC